MKKYFIFAAFAGIALTSCTDDDFVGNVSPPAEVNSEEMSPLTFTSSQANFTRADLKGAEAATKLGKKFVVFGYKGTSTGTPGTTVFDNYLVEYAENTANTTESNSANWEYASKGLIKHAIDHEIVAQTIKYWDFTKTQYDFFAWSTGPKTAIYEGTPTTNQVLVSAMNATKAADPETGLATAYTFTGKAADLKECYISDLVTVYKGAVTGSPTYNVVANGYKQPVTLKFRQLGTKVRIGIYETVPGYSVKNVKFYTTGDVLAADEVYGAAKAKIVDNATIFTNTANEIFTEGTYTVSFPTVDAPTDANNNQAHIAFAGSGAQTTVVEWGALDYTYREQGESNKGKVYLGRTSNTATFAGNAADDYYVVYLPNENGTNLNLRVDYTLESIDGGKEVIEVKNAKAQVPLIYTQWKPGFAYTYLFKISDETNGWTGNYDPTKPDNDPYNADPVGLFPITFDALVVNAEEDKTQETITTISTPSITTYQKGSAVVNNNEYTANGNNIFVTVNESNALVTLTDKAAVYEMSTEKAYTEADVIDAFTYTDDVTESGYDKTGRNGLDLKTVTSTLVSEIEYGADGNKIKDVGTDKALSFAPASGKNYAFVYTQSAGTTTNKYQPVTKTVGAAVGENVFRYALKAGTAGDVEKGVTYFAKNDATENAITAFLGQDVSNLYLNATGTQQASGNAKTGTSYWYTDDNGLTFKAVAPITYATFKDATDLYTYNGTTYVLKTDASPVPGTAYYQKTTVGSVDTYTFCVIYPQRAETLFVIDTNEANVVAASGTAVEGMIYLDKYTKNDGVRYAKIIKVQ
ncbi:MAG: hypothetical protein IKZ48_00830 [Prevotella sp.]|nr:hypothetical protein [Prevotella sp.]